MSGKKLKFPDEKVVASDTKSMASVPVVQSEPETLLMFSSCTATTVTVTMDSASFSTRYFGIQCSMDRSRVEHHKVIETVKVFKKGDAEVSQDMMGRVIVI